MPNYDDLQNKQNELIRKALDGSCFVGALSRLPITNLTVWVPAAVGPPAVPAHAELKALPAGWDDLGFLTNDGMGFDRSVSNAETTSFGRVTPTRTDVTSDTSTLTVTAQETKLLTIGMATGADLAAATPDTNTGEIRVEKPSRPKTSHYRALSLAVDLSDAGEIYIARYFPRAKVSNYAAQSFGGDGEITWGVTLTGEEDSAVGFSESWLFGGPGWKAQLVDMGFPAAA